jgi:hypothetical protein
LRHVAVFQLDGAAGRPALAGVKAQRLAVKDGTIAVFGKDYGCCLGRIGQGNPGITHVSYPPDAYDAQYIILSIALKDLLRGTLLTILNQLWYTWRRILKAGQRSIPFRRMPQSLWGDAEDENPGNWEELIGTHP